MKFNLIISEDDLYNLTYLLTDKIGRLEYQIKTKKDSEYLNLWKEEYATFKQLRSNLYQQKHIQLNIKQP